MAVDPLDEILARYGLAPADATRTRRNTPPVLPRRTIGPASGLKGIPEPRGHATELNPSVGHAKDPATYLNDKAMHALGRVADEASWWVPGVSEVRGGGEAGKLAAEGDLPGAGLMLAGSLLPGLGKKIPKFRAAAIKLADGRVFEGGHLHYSAVEEALNAVRNGRGFTSGAQRVKAWDKLIAGATVGYTDEADHFLSKDSDAGKRLVQMGHRSFASGGPVATEEIPRKAWAGGAPGATGTPGEVKIAKPKRAVADTSFTVFHGTTHPGELKPGGANPKLSGEAIWFGTDPDNLHAAHNIGGFGGIYKPGSHVRELEATMKRPLRVTAENKRAMQERYGSTFPYQLSPEARQLFKKDGYDGVIFENQGAKLPAGNPTEGFVLEADQLKEKGRRPLKTLPDSVVAKAAKVGTPAQVPTKGVPAVADLLKTLQRPDAPNLPRVAKASPEHGAAFAKTYESLPKNDPAAAEAYKTLNAEVEQQFKAMQDAGYTVEFVDHDPYKSSAEMMADVRDNKRLKVFKTPRGLSNTKSPGEQIIAAAIREGGKVYTGPSHLDAADLLGTTTYAGKDMDAALSRAEEGFLVRAKNGNERFVSRKEAEQLTRRPALSQKRKLTVPNPEGLHSSDLPNSLMDRADARVIDENPSAFHPFMTPEQNDKFRAVHDWLAHAGEGHQFGPTGEENAYRVHASTLSPLARRALATETRGQNSWVNFGPNAHLPAKERPFAEQKAALWPEELTGDYPKETVAGVAMRNPKTGQIISHAGFDGGHEKLRDAHGWESGERGFITSSGRYIPRTEALAIAREQHQLKPGADAAIKRTYEDKGKAGVVGHVDLQLPTKPLDFRTALNAELVKNPQTDVERFASDWKKKGGVVGDSVGGRVVKKGIEVWHGSPHKFSSFDLSNLGKGSGGYDYGRGLYFTENIDEAKGYAPINEKYQSAVQKLYDDAEKRRDYAALSVYEGAALHKTPKELTELFPETEYAPALAKIAQLSKGGVHNLYRASILAKPNTLLNWDRSISEQTPYVQNALESRFRHSTNSRRFLDTNPTGGDFYSSVMRPSDPSATGLVQAGVPGLTYRSDRLGAGHNNYVMFDPSRVKLLEALGLFGAGLGLNALRPDSTSLWSLLGQP